MAGAAGESVGDRDADAGGSGEAGPQESEEGVEQGLGASARPGCADHEDEGRRDPSGPQVGAGDRHGERGGGRHDGPDDGWRRHGVAAEHAGRSATPVGGVGGGARGSRRRQGLSLEQDDGGNRGARAAELRERAQPGPPERRRSENACWFTPPPSTSGC